MALARQCAYMLLLLAAAAAAAAVIQFSVFCWLAG
jgi:hypothetical protein